MTDRLLYSMREVAEAFGVSYDQVRQMTLRRELATVHVGRRRMIPAREVDRYLTEHYVAAALEEQAAGEVVTLAEFGRAAGYGGPASLGKSAPARRAQ
jgi:excisionase family DNA binding protein